jgi:hypothetical protein
MIDDYLDYALKINDNDPPEGASETWVAENMEEITGWLRRKPIGGMKQWEWMFFQVKEGKLKYFIMENDITPHGVFNFKQLTATLETRGERKFCVEIHSCSHQFYYKARTKEERQLWVTVLSINLNLHSPMDQILTLVASKENFWKIEKISNLKFLCVANTADILLFQAKNVGAKIQRKIAGSRFDHVAMVLCHGSGRISIFEATNQDGVALVDWDQFFEQNWLDLYSLVVYRKVEFERTETMLNNLQKFINESKGKKFSFNVKKMIVKNTKKAGQEEDFFCSELVASAFKSIGILSPDFDTSKVWPVNFEKEDTLPLQNAKFGPLLEIDFDLLSMD